jgi:hypothetical protein
MTYLSAKRLNSPGLFVPWHLNDVPAHPTSRNKNGGVADVYDPPSDQRECQQIMISFYCERMIGKLRGRNPTQRKKLMFA